MNKSRFKITLLAALVTTVLTLLFTSCGNNSNEPAFNLSLLVVGANNNMPVNTKQIAELRSLSAAPNSDYALLECDGNPRFIKRGTIKDLSSMNLLGSALEEEKAKIRAGIRKEITENAVPFSPEVDLWTGLRMSVDFLREKEQQGRENVLVIYGSGLSTTNVLNFVSTSFESFTKQKEDAIKKLTDANQLDLTGIKVICYGFGETSGDQAPLTYDQKRELKSFYKDLFAALGAKAEDVIFNDYVPDETLEVPRFNYSVSEVDVSVSDPDSVFDEFIIEETSFISNTWDLKSPSETKTLLKDKVINVLDKNPGINITIIGTTSSFGDDPKQNKEFSQGRAEKIKNLLLELGLDEDRIQECIGVGHSCEALYTYDKNPDGTLNEALADQNRRVIIFSGNSKKLAEVLASVK